MGPPDGPRLIWLPAWQPPSNPEKATYKVGLLIQSSILVGIISTMVHIQKPITVVPGFRALGLLTAKSALNPGSALFPRLDLVHFEL